MALQAIELSKNVRHAAYKGARSMDNAIQAMDTINASTRNIAKIVGIVDEIACQANWLAQNASTEAARLGAQESGFAVVAAEMTNLAHRSNTAAQEIRELIQDGVETTRAGAELLNESGETLEEILIGVKKVEGALSNIAILGKQHPACA